MRNLILIDPAAFEIHAYESCTQVRITATSTGKDRAKWLQNAIRAMKDKRDKRITLLLLKMRSQREIAAILEMPRSTVEYRIEKIKAFLRSRASRQSVVRLQRKEV